MVGDDVSSRRAAVEAWAADLARPVERIDLAPAPGRAVDEIERALDQAFARAREHQAILVLDGADALFGPAESDAADATVLALLRHRLDHHDGPVAFGTTRRPEADQLEAGRIGAVIEVGAKLPLQPGPAPHSQAGPAQRRDLVLIRRILQQVEKLPLQPGGQRLTLPGEPPARVDFHVGLLVEAGLVRGTLHRAGSGETTLVLVERLTWSGHDALALLAPAGPWEDARTRFLDTEGRGDFTALLEGLRRRPARPPEPPGG